MAAAVVGTGSVGSNAFTSLEPPETTAELLMFPTAPQRSIHRPVFGDWLRAQQALNESCVPLLRKRARRINACCCGPQYVARSTGGIGVVAGYCRDRLCPTCQRLRGTAVAAAVRGAIHGMDCVRFITLTLAQVDRPLEDTLKILSAAFRRLRAQPEWKKHIRGGVYAVEVVFSPTSLLWHAHLHVLADGLFWSQRDLSDLWRKTTGDSFIVDIRMVGSRQAAANYVAKYVAKPMDSASWPDAKLCEYAEALHGKRMVHTFGAKYGEFKEEEEPGTVKATVEVLCSANQLQRAAKLHDAYACMALELLQRTRGMTRTAVSGPPTLSPMPFAPLEPWEDERLLECLRVISTISPGAPPAKKTRWDTGGPARIERQGLLQELRLCT